MLALENGSEAYGGVAEKLGGSGPRRAWSWTKIGAPSDAAEPIRYDHYTEGIVYSPYDTGEPIHKLPVESRSKILVRQKGGGWKLQSEM